MKITACKTWRSFEYFHFPVLCYSRNTFSYPHSAPDGKMANAKNENSCRKLESLSMWLWKESFHLITCTFQNTVKRFSEVITLLTFDSDSIISLVQGLLGRAYLCSIGMSLLFRFLIVLEQWIWILNVTLTVTGTIYRWQI